MGTGGRQDDAPHTPARGQRKRHHELTADKNKEVVASCVVCVVGYAVLWFVGEEWQRQGMEPQPAATNTPLKLHDAVRPARLWIDSVPFLALLCRSLVAAVHDRPATWSVRPRVAALLVVSDALLVVAYFVRQHNCVAAAAVLALSALSSAVLVHAAAVLFPAFPRSTLLCSLAVQCGAGAVGAWEDAHVAVFAATLALVLVAGVEHARQTARARVPHAGVARTLLLVYVGAGLCACVVPVLHATAADRVLWWEVVGKCLVAAGCYANNGFFVAHDLHTMVRAVERRTQSLVASPPTTPTSATPLALVQALADSVVDAEEAVGAVLDAATTNAGSLALVLEEGLCLPLEEATRALLAHHAILESGNGAAVESFVRGLASASSLRNQIGVAQSQLAPHRPVRCPLLFMRDHEDALRCSGSVSLGIAVDNVLEEVKFRCWDEEIKLLATLPAVGMLQRLDVCAELCAALTALVSGVLCVALPGSSVFLTVTVGEGDLEVMVNAPACTTVELSTAFGTSVSPVGASPKQRRRRIPATATATAPPSVPPPSPTSAHLLFQGSVSFDLTLGLVRKLVVHAGGAVVVDASRRPIGPRHGPISAVLRVPICPPFVRRVLAPPPPALSLCSVAVVVSGFLRRDVRESLLAHGVAQAGLKMYDENHTSFVSEPVVVFVEPTALRGRERFQDIRSWACHVGKGTAVLVCDTPLRSCEISAQVQQNNGAPGFDVLCALPAGVARVCQQLQRAAECAQQRGKELQHSQHTGFTPGKEGGV